MIFDRRDLGQVPHERRLTLKSYRPVVLIRDRDGLFLAFLVGLGGALGALTAYSSIVGVALVVVLCAIGSLSFCPTQTVLGLALGEATLVVAISGNSSAPKGVFLGSIALGTVLILTGIVIRVSHEGHGSDKTRKMPVQSFFLLVYYSLLCAWTLVYWPSQISQALVPAILPVLVLVVSNRLNSKDIRVFLRAIVIIAVLEVLLGYLELFAVEKPLWGYRNSVARANPFLDNSVERVQGTTGHPITFSFLVCIAFIVVLWNGIEIDRKSRFVLILLLLSGILIGGTRSAVIAVVAGCVVAGLFGRPLRARIYAGSVAAITVAAYVFNLGNLKSISDNGLNSDSFAHRLDGLSAVTGLLDQNLIVLIFGNGTGGVARLFQLGKLQTDGFLVVDNQYITAYIVSGLLGLAALVAALSISIKNGDALVRGCLVFAVCMFLSFDALTWILCGLILSLFVCIGSKRTVTAEPDPGSVGSSGSALVEVANVG